MAGDLIIVALVMAWAWWMTGYDSKLSGNNTPADYARRIIRCGIVFLLLLAALAGFLPPFTLAMIAIVMASCGAEFGARMFHNLLDPEDRREFNPKLVHARLDLLAEFVREERVTDALNLCTQLQKSGEASALALEATIYQLYHETLQSMDTAPMLEEVRRLRGLGQFAQAEDQLKQILARSSGDWAAMLLLLRIYAEDMAQPDRAQAWLQPSEQSAPPQLHPAFTKYAQRSIEEWSQAAVNRSLKARRAEMAASRAGTGSANAVGAPSVDELLKNGQFSTAIEVLERNVREEPQSFDAWMKLAEAYALYCRDVTRAERIIRNMELARTFSPEQIEFIRAKFREWRATTP
jgi:hypothetical protein